jgi:hypothetical protein
MLTACQLGNFNLHVPGPDVASHKQVLIDYKDHCTTRKMGKDNGRYVMYNDQEKGIM